MDFVCFQVFLLLLLYKPTLEFSEKRKRNEKIIVKLMLRMELGRVTVDVSEQEIVALAKFECK